MLLLVSQSRQILIVWAAGLLPIAAVIIQHSTLYDGVRHLLFLIPPLAVIASSGFHRFIPTLCRFPLLAATILGAYGAYAVITLALLHPLEYVSFNTFVGGVRGAYSRFDMDYWSIAAAPALRALERRLDYENLAHFSERPPSVMVCIGSREALVAPMFRRRWRLETDAREADFIIATERWPCVQNGEAMLINEIRRFDRTFARIYARK